MFFDSMRAAREYAKDQTTLCRGKLHKAIACKQWRVDRITGEYALHDCFTVVLA